ncbi:transcription initiation factor TFIID subunit 4, partial [Elysia marginata]
MAERGSIDELLSKELDRNKITSPVGSLVQQRVSAGHKPVQGSTYNNNHIVGNSFSNAPNSNIPTPSPSVRPQHTVMNMHGLPAQSSVVLNNKMLPPNLGVNSSVRSNVSNPQIIGISSVMNASQQNRTNSNSSVPLSNIASTCMHQTIPITKSLGSSPSIRIVANTTKTTNSPLHNTTLLPPNSQLINTAMPHNATIVRTQQPRVLNSASGASTAIHNLASIAAEQKPLTVLPNGNMHLQSGQNKEGTVIPHQQIIVKSDANHTVVKSDIPMTLSNSVMQGIRQNPSVIAGQQQIIKSVPAMNQNLVTVRNNVRQPLQHIVVRASVATTLANSSPSVQVVNASGAGTPSTIRPTVTPQIRPGPVRISNPVRISQHPNIAPRQQNSQTGTLTIPPGALLMKNENGQLVLVSASQTVLQQNASSNSIVTTVSPGAGYRIQNVRPHSSQAPIRTASSGPATVSIQPQGTQQQQQLLQVRGSISTLQQQAPRPVGTVNQTVSQLSSSTNQSTTAAVHSGEMNKAMLENVKKCKNFLSTLIKLAHSQPPETVKNVQALIQGLIDGKVEPEMFTERLQQELQSSPQPYLVPFLKKSLPLLRQSMLKGQMTIEGIKPPPPEILTPQVHSAVVPRGQQSSVGAQQVRGTFQQRPILPQHQMTVRAPGPQSSRVAPIRHASAPAIRHQGQQPTQQHVVRPNTVSAAVRPVTSQVAHITPGGGKVVVHASPQPQQVQVKPKASSRPVNASNARTSKASMGSPAPGSVKSEVSSLGPAPKEKRKFESIKDGDDDFNDVATMGGVNLSEESKNILATTNADFIGAQSRSCKDEIFLAASPLLKKITAAAKKHGIEEISPAVVNLISHATQERLRELVSKLSTTAEHRVEIYKMDTRFEVASETKQKLKFLEELDKLEKKRHEEQEREKLLRAIKSRSKNEDPEQLKLKQKAKELQQAEAEELRQKEANMTALAAIGPRKKRKLDFSDSGQPGSSTSSSLLNSSVNSPRGN